MCDHFLAKLASSFRDQVSFTSGGKAGENDFNKDVREDGPN